MGNLFGNSRIGNIHAENEVAEILAHFNSDFIEAIMADKLNERLNVNYQLSTVNLVESLEQNFKQIIDCYQEEQRNIWNKRCNVYSQIINHLSNAHGMVINPSFESRSGYYMEALFMYDFFISNYINYAVTFFANMIYNNVDSIFKYLGLDEHKNNNPYIKKVFSANIKLGILIDNIEACIKCLCGFDYTFDDILQVVYSKQNKDIFDSLLRDSGDFYKTFYVPLFNTDIGSVLLTHIKIALTSMYATSNSDTALQNALFTK